MSASGQAHEQVLPGGVNGGNKQTNKQFDKMPPVYL